MLYIFKIKIDITLLRNFTAFLSSSSQLPHYISMGRASVQVIKVVLRFASNTPGPLNQLAMVARGAVWSN